MTYVESEIVEPRAELVNDICKEVVTFDSSRGGTPYIGIADDGIVIMRSKSPAEKDSSRHSPERY